MIEMKLGTNGPLRSYIHRVGHTVGHGMTFPAKTDDVLDEQAAWLDGYGFVAAKTPGRIVHEGMGIPGSFRYDRRQDDPEDQAAKPDLFNSF